MHEFKKKTYCSYEIFASKSAHSLKTRSSHRGAAPNLDVRVYLKDNEGKE